MTETRLWPALLLVAALALTAWGCGGDNGKSTPTDRAVVTFTVPGGERFKVLLTTPELVDHAQKLLKGENVSAIPNGLVVRGEPGVNTGYTWHLDPATFEFAFATIEVCDGLPSDVEKHLVTSDRYCPWTAKVVAVDATR